MQKIKGRTEFHPAIEWSAVIIFGVLFAYMFASQI